MTTSLFYCTKCTEVATLPRFLGIINAEKVVRDYVLWTTTPGKMKGLPELCRIDRTTEARNTDVFLREQRDQNLRDVFG